MTTREQTQRGLASPMPLPDVSPRKPADWDEHEDTSVDHGYDSYAPQRPTSTRRFTSQVPTVATPRAVIRVTHHPVPPRARAMQQQVATPQDQRPPSPRPAPMSAKSAVKKRPRWVGYVGMALVVMVIGWLVLSLLANWWQGTLDDWRYGRPRTSQMDAVVGGDSVAAPTHFLATNVAGHISVIEMHASDPNKTTVLIAPMQAAPLDPVTLVVKDVDHDGKPDLLVMVHGAAHVFINDGHGNFGPLKPGDTIDIQ